MKIICTKSNLAKGVSIVSKAVPSKTTMPILECILIDATTDIIRLTANDMELGIQTEIEGEILDRGMIAIDARIFSEIVRKLRMEEAALLLRGGKLSSKEISYRVGYSSPEHFSRTFKAYFGLSPEAWKKANASI